MTRSTTAQNLVLEGLVQGREYLLILTKSPGANSLMFSHLDDPDMAVHPAHSAVADATVVTKFFCPSPVMTLYFAVAPVATYYVTVEPITTPEF